MPGPQPEGTAPLTGHVPFRSQVHSLEKLTLLSESTGSALWETLCLSLFSSSGSRVSFRDPVPGASFRRAGTAWAQPHWVCAVHSHGQ